MTKEAFYFGCWGTTPGHYFHDVRGAGRLYNLPQSLPWTLGHMDGGLLKNGRIPDNETGAVYRTLGGAAELWHAFFWWDNSVDRRGASNSGFYVRGFEAREWREAFAFACEQFPAVVERQRRPLELVDKS